ncbi:MAG: 3-hydroxyacyl-ACP dehydratase FabZ [Micavibrio sp.]
MIPAVPFGKEEIERILPHRDPFLLLDEVIDLDPGRKVVATRLVRADDWWFPGHFPDRPVMPGVLIVEAMAQTSAILVVQSMGKEAEGKLVYFMTIDNARFRKPVTPGDTMYIHVKKDRNRGGVWKFSAEARVDDVLCAEATYSAMILDK